MKKLLVICTLLFLVSCQEEEVLDQTPDTSENQDLLSIEEINSFIDKQLEAGGIVSWKANPEYLYSAAMRGGGIVTIGYGQEGESFSTGQKRIAATSLQKEIIGLVSQSENDFKNDESLVLSTDAVLNVVDVKVNSLETILNLVDQKDIRYLEPNGYSSYSNTGVNKTIGNKSGSGCNRDPDVLNNNDVTNINPGSLLPWNYSIHNIDKAWTTSTGSGITIGIIDTGLSASQIGFGSEFNAGDSRGRSVERFGTYIDSFWPWSRNVDGPDDKCGHGSFMAAAIAAPRANRNVPVGVAYNSNIITYRAVSDVIIDDYHEKKGVSDALVALANRSDVKIISMSLGALFPIGNVMDAMKYAYSKGKLIFVAGGTSTSFTSFVGVTFPATMDEAVAVTGVTDASQYRKCGNCHSGSKIEFTVAMQRAGNTDRTVPIMGFETGQTAYEGGSSIATAMTAGMAALVWSKNPNWTREQVLQKLRSSGELYPNRDAQYGFGNIDMLKALR